MTTEAEFKNTTCATWQADRPIEPGWFAARGFTSCAAGWHLRAGSDVVLARPLSDGRWALRHSQMIEGPCARYHRLILVTWEDELAGLFGGLLGRLPVGSPAAATEEHRQGPQGLLF